MFINHLSSSIGNNAKRELPVKTQLIWLRQHKKYLAFSLATKTKIWNTIKQWIQSPVLREIITNHVGPRKCFIYTLILVLWHILIHQLEARTALINENMNHKSHIQDLVWRQLTFHYNDSRLNSTQGGQRQKQKSASLIYSSAEKNEEK